MNNIIAIILVVMFLTLVSFSRYKAVKQYRCEHDYIDQREGDDWYWLEYKQCTKCKHFKDVIKCRKTRIHYD